MHDNWWVILLTRIYAWVLCDNMQLRSQCDQLISTVVFSIPLDDIFLLLDSLSQWVTQSDLSEVLQSCVNGVTDGVIEHALHASHQHLQSLYHSNYLPKAQHSINDNSSSRSKYIYVCMCVIRW